MKTREQTKRLEDRRKRKRLHVRRRLRDNVALPRLSVFRSSKNIYGQIINDVDGVTIVAASSRDKALRDALGGKKKTDVAVEVGKALAARAKEKGIGKVRFDRGSYKFHGRVKALAEAAREGGLEF
ncbi:MAG: 50S ribosomal protein L18 [Planctomycetes bacterium]|nr:50S ribosomal protein L18 [Planctomycetota bacterium]